MGYSEGNTYKPIQKWTLFVRDHKDDAWQVLDVTEDRETVDLYVIDLNQKAGWQRYAVSQHTK